MPFAAFIWSQCASSASSVGDDLAGLLFEQSAAEWGWRGRSCAYIREPTPDIRLKENFLNAFRLLTGVYPVVESDNRIEYFAASARRESPMTVYQYEMLTMAMRALGGRQSLSALAQWCAEQGVTLGDPHAVASVITVNDRNRFQGNRNSHRTIFRTDLDDPKDVLYRRGAGRDKTYELYDSSIHGIWDGRELSPGRFFPFCLVEPELVQAIQAPLLELQDGTLPADVAPDVDTRKKALRLIAQREGAVTFRSSLVRAYGGACVITGCRVVEILEAAHIKPYRGVASNAVNNGVLLRADVHTLFDKGLIWLNESFRVVISSRLGGSEYEIFSGRPISAPQRASDLPLADNVADHRSFALALENRRKQEDEDQL